MTIQTPTPLMPAHDTTKPTTATDSGEGVRDMALFEPREGREVRAWDELSEIDRQVILESVRQRRRQQAQQQRIHNEIYRLRSVR